MFCNYSETPYVNSPVGSKRGNSSECPGGSCSSIFCWRRDCKRETIRGERAVETKEGIETRQIEDVLLTLCSDFLLFLTLRRPCPFSPFFLSPPSFAHTGQNVCSVVNYIHRRIDKLLWYHRAPGLKREKCGRRTFRSERNDRGTISTGPVIATEMEVVQECTDPFNLVLRIKYC